MPLTDHTMYQELSKIIRLCLKAVLNVETFNWLTNYLKKSTILFFKMIWILKAILSGFISVFKTQEREQEWNSICSISLNLKVSIMRGWKCWLTLRRNLRMKEQDGIEVEKTSHTFKTTIEEKLWLTIKDAIILSRSPISLSMIRTLYFLLTVSPTLIQT